MNFRETDSATYSAKELLEIVLDNLLGLNRYPLLMFKGGYQGFEMLVEHIYRNKYIIAENMRDFSTRMIINFTDSDIFIKTIANVIKQGRGKGISKNSWLTAMDKIIG